MNRFALLLACMLPCVIQAREQPPPLVIDLKARPQPAFIRHPDGREVEIPKQDLDAPASHYFWAPGMLITLVVPHVVGNVAGLPDKVRARVAGTIGPDGVLRDTTLSVTPEHPQVWKEIARVLPSWLFLPRGGGDCNYGEMPIEFGFEIDNASWKVKYVYEPPVLAPSAPRENRVAGLRKNALPIKRFAPRFPRNAMNRGANDVEFVAHLNVDDVGKVKGVSFVPHTYLPLFADEMQRAFLKWEFAPGDPFCGEVMMRFKYDPQPS